MPRQSLCWKLLTLQQDKKTVECSICRHQMAYSGGSTSNLMRHLKVKHPIEFDLETEKKVQRHNPMKEEASTSANPGLSTTKLSQPTLAQSFERTAAYKPDSAKKKQLDEEVLDLILIDMQPLSIVEQRGFRKLLRAFDPKYEMVSRKRLAQQLLPERYSKAKRMVMDELSQVKHISITTDCWTSRANEAYTTITAHFLTPDWELRTRVLMTRSESKRHTAENLATEIQTTLQEFGIDSKVTTIVTDNARNIKNAVEITKIRHLPCFAHTLNLTVRESIDTSPDVKEVIKRVKDIVSYFHSSTVATNSLRETHANRGGTFKKLKQDVETRWNSTFDMLKSYLGQHEEVTTALCLSGKMQLCLSETDLSEAKEAMEVLEPFYEATAEMSTEKNTSASKVIPLVKSLCKITARGTSALSKALNRILNQRFSGIEDKTHLRLATLLDPRFKKAGFTTTESANSAVIKLKEVVKKITIPCERQQEEVEDITAPPPSKKPSLLWSEFDEEISHLERVSSTKICATELEVKHFLESPGIRRDRDPLAWWREHSGALPRLELIAKDVLAIPATSVPCERIFSKAGELISARRAQLKKTNVDMILFLNKNM